MFLWDMEGQQSNWKDKRENFGKALATLTRFAARPNIDEMEQAGLIKGFEFTFELAWKTLQALFDARGFKEVRGPRPVLAQALKDGFLLEAKVWEDMIDTRNMSSHVYRQALADESEENIRARYLEHLTDLHTRLSALD